MKTTYLIPLLAWALAACGTANQPASANQAAGAHAPATPAPATSAARAETGYPALTGRVVDSAELLTPAEEASLSADLEALERRTTDQFVIVTVPNLGGREIDSYSRDLGNHWRIGQAGRNNGVLLVVAPAEHKVRIEVGSGLTSTLTNERASEIIQRDIIPQLRAGQWHDGIRAGSRAIIATLTSAGNDGANASR